MRLAIVLVLALAGCGPIVQIGGNAPAPDSLLTLRAGAPPPDTVAGAPILVALPAVTGALKTLRIPVTTSDTEIAYLAAANWVEQPNQLFQRVLADVVSRQTGRPVIDERTGGAAPALRLSGRLVEFGLDVRSGHAAKARFDAVLTSASEGVVGSRSFEAAVPVTSEAGPAVASALNAAANMIARDVGDWVARQKA